jgi:hypothetical protein
VILYEQAGWPIGLPWVSKTRRSAFQLASGLWQRGADLNRDDTRVCDLRVMSLFNSPNSRKHQMLTCNYSNDLRGNKCLVFSLFSVVLAYSVGKMLEKDAG